ncbi:amidase [Celerinatantimonas diazotrophica]|uniref:Aspartyl-tRNA(Asn)/glutamyl-tRNA(Gln) amidotransferase subunit A n=1 Tax=Celerinatantimonas diazotrophica TaxID=412034 RepID=A0A4R1J869_9GAMM|nr:amidase [Celerinatantimonas diazotrophica]TCK46763.1 aspartyl-tRNA(Asn)/glutamyl-tRNA(Gln) amidotransferase subunit A [Celerinatantimonas diazotrophica]CAG9295466.1 2-amino-5-chloromuconic acid deaminase [Celerinatantimonas diazotrophica]
MDDDSVYCAHGPHQLASLADGPLDGLRFVYKDLYDVAGFTTGAGNPSWFQEHAPASYTAPLIEMLRYAGAMAVGRVQTDELAYSLNGCNVHFGTPINPMTPDRLPGGSSSGSAVAVARGDAEFALGTDTGGSIRIPAAYNSLYSLRPTHGRLPMAGVLPLAPRFDTPGWLSRDAQTLEQVGSVLFGLPKASLNAPSLAIVEPLFARLPEPLALLWQSFFKSISSQFTTVAAPFSAAQIDALSDVFQILQGRQIASLYHHWHQMHPDALGKDIDQRLSWTATLSAAAQHDAEQKRQQWLSQLHSCFALSHFIVIPTTPDLSPLRTADSLALGEFRMRLMGMTAMAGLAGCPQLHLPLLACDGVPFGFSIIGPRDSDMQLLALARLFSQL